MFGNENGPYNIQVSKVIVSRFSVVTINLACVFLNFHMFSNYALNLTYLNTRKFWYSLLSQSIPKNQSDYQSWKGFLYFLQMLKPSMWTTRLMNLLFYLADILIQNVNWSFFSFLCTTNMILFLVHMDKTVHLCHFL